MLPRDLLNHVENRDTLSRLLDLGDRAVQTWEVEFPSGAIWFFSGFVKMWKEAETTVEGVRGFTGSIRITGKTEYAPTGISS